MALYWGWVVCVSFLALLTLSQGVVYSFGEMIVPISHQFNTSMTLLSKYML